MAFPTTLSLFDFLPASSQGRTRPVISSNGVIWIVGGRTDDSGLLQLWEGTDPADSFNPDSGDALTIANSGVLLGIGSVHDDDGLNLHIATQDDNDAILYHVFLTGISGSFTTINEAVTSAVGTDVDAEKAISISLETDGSIIIFYQGASDNDMGAKERVDRAYKPSGGSWTVDQAVDDAGANNYFLGGIVRGEADKFHFLYGENTAASEKAFHRSVQDVDGTLSSQELGPSDNSDINFACLQPIYYDSSGVETIVCGISINVTNPRPAEFRVEDDGSPPSLADILTLTILHLAGEFAVYSLAVDGTDVWALFVDTDQDLWSDVNSDDGGWGTDVEELDGVTINLITSNVYQRGSDIVLAYVYDDGGTIKYNEKVLRAAAAEAPFPPFERRINPRLRM